MLNCSGDNKHFSVGGEKLEMGEKKVMYSNLPNNNLKMVECVCVYLRAKLFHFFNVPKPLPQN